MVSSCRSGEREEANERGNSKAEEARRRQYKMSGGSPSSWILEGLNLLGWKA
jgi:hypothetical protein